MSKQSKMKLLSVTYKVGNKVQTAMPANTETSQIISEHNLLIPHDNQNSDDDQFKCINGQLYIKVCFGGDCHWAPAGQNC